MAESSINLTLRFLLELAALGAFAYWGWTTHEGAPRYLWAIGLPIVTAALWATFRVPGDGGDPIVVVPGAARLALELAFFGGAVWLLAAAASTQLALGFGALVVLHYVVSYSRVLWLLGR